MKIHHSYERRFLKERKKQYVTKYKLPKGKLQCAAKEKKNIKFLKPISNYSSI